jgi:hypothetical protein
LGTCVPVPVLPVSFTSRDSYAHEVVSNEKTNK